MFLIFSYLVGCSAKQSPTKNQGANEANELIGTTKNINHLTPQKESSKTLQLTTPKTQEKLILDVPLIAQNPELKYGCEVTSLALVLQYAGIKVNKTELANSIKKDNS